MRYLCSLHLLYFGSVAGYSGFEATMCDFQHDSLDRPRT
jgi:hypothetical protein